MIRRHGAKFESKGLVWPNTFVLYVFTPTPSSMICDGNTTKNYPLGHHRSVLSSKLVFCKGTSRGLGWLEHKTLEVVARGAVGVAF